MSRKKYSKNLYPNPYLAKETLEIARRDLEASKLLHDNGLLPQSVYFLEQSVEKGCKSFGFFAGIIDQYEARSPSIIGHNPLNIYDKSMDVYKNILQYMIDTANIYNNAQTAIAGSSIDTGLFSEWMKDIDEEHTVLNGLSDDRSDIQKLKRALTSDNMNKLMSDINTFISTVDREKQRLDDESFYSDTLHSARQDLRKFVLKTYCHSQFAVLGLIELNKITDDEIMSLFTYIMDNMVITPPLLALAIITLDHENTTRYAEMKEKKLKYSPDDPMLSALKIYTNDHPILQNFDYIEKITDSSLTRLDHIYKTVDPFSTGRLITSMNYIE